MMKKIIFLYLFCLVFINKYYPNDFMVKKLNCDDFSYSKHHELNNDFKFFNNNFYIFCLKDYTKEEEKKIYKNPIRLYKGFLNEIMIFTDKYDFKEKINISRGKFDYGLISKNFYPDKNNNLVLYKRKYKDGISSDNIEIYDIKENLLKTFTFPGRINSKGFFVSNDYDILYYFNYVLVSDYIFKFIYSIYDLKNNKHKTIDSTKRITNSTVIDCINNMIYSSYFGIYIYIYNQNDVNELEDPLPVKNIVVDDFLYQKYNLIFYHNNNFYGILIKDKIIYQIRFLSSSEEQRYNNGIYTFQSQSKQTLLIGINTDTDKLVKEIRINYEPRWIFDAPNSYDVDDEGNIYILDSKNKNIIKINKDVIKLEIDYNKY